MNKTNEQAKSAIAAIDLGSNSFHLAIGTILDGQIHLLETQRRVVRLYSALTHDRYLKGSALDLAYQGIDFFAQRLSAYRIRALRIVGTAALRQAKDSKKFLDYIRQRLEAPVEIIEGTLEASLMYTGAVHPLPIKKRLVLDIGGGSTECAIGTGFQCEYTASTSCGCIPLQQQFLPTGVISQEAFTAIRARCRMELLEMVPAITARAPWEEVLVACGIAQTLEEMVHALGGDVLNRSWMEQLAQRCFIGRTVQTLSLPGVTTDRQWVLPTGLAILMTFCELLGIEEVHVSPFALREGVLLSM